MRTRDYRLVRPPQRAAVMRDCPLCAGGWDTCANEASPAGRLRAAWIRQECQLRFAELHATASAVLGDGIVYPGEIDASTEAAAPVTVFRFAGGQPCFNHPEPFRMYAGTRVHRYLEDWIEDLDEHAGRLTEAVARG